MLTVGATLSYLLMSVMILALCFLWVAALLDVQSQMRTGGVSSYKILVVIAIAISVLAVCLIVATDALFIDNRGEPFSPWSDWGVRLGS
jgi:amino acid transporter